MCLFLSQVKYQPQFSADVQFETVESSDILNVTLTDLRKFTEYDVQVLAYSRMGDGMLSDISKVKTAGDSKSSIMILYVFLLFVLLFVLLFKKVLFSQCCLNICKHFVPKLLNRGNYLP